MNNDVREPAEIEQTLSETRERLDHRLGALQEKLKPRQLINDSLAYLQGGDGADLARDLFARVRSNPVPAAMIASGIAWLLVSKSRTGQPDDLILRERLRQAESGVSRTSEEDDASYGHRLAQARGRVFGLTQDVGETVSDYSERISGAISALGHAGGTSPGDKLRNSKAFVTSPLGLGAMAAAAGLVIGSIIPSSDYERQQLGTQADRLRSAGRKAAQGVVDSAGRVAGEVASIVREGAKEKGLTTAKPIGEAFADARSGDLVRDAKEVLSDAFESGKAALHNELQPEGGN